jgi:hypothetical protein
MSGGESFPTPEETPAPYDGIDSERIAKDAVQLYDIGLINPIIKILKARQRNAPFDTKLPDLIKKVETWRNELLRRKAAREALALYDSQVARFDEVMIGFTMPVDRRTVVRMDKIERDALETLSRAADE